VTCTTLLCIRCSAALNTQVQGVRRRPQTPVIVCMCRAGGPNSFGVWSLRWSADGREIIAGTADCSVYVYDMDRRKARHCPLLSAATRVPHHGV